MTPDPRPIPMRSAWALGILLGMGACDPTARLAPPAEGAASDAEETLPNDPLPWEEDEGDEDTDTGDPVTPPGLRVVEVAAGDRTSCERTSDGMLDCWGYNVAGAGTEPSGTYRTVVSAGLWSCGLTSSGSLTCWGDVAGTLLSPPAGPFDGVALAADAACAWDGDGALSCWGDLAQPPANLPDVVTAAVGERFACVADADGEVICFGRGELDPPDGLVATALFAGDDHACALTTEDRAVCWGANAEGQADAPDGAFTSLALSGDTSCGLASDGSLSCWGADGDVFAPDGLTALEAVALGDAHGCGVDRRGDTVCWGDDRYGQASAPIDDAVAVAVGPERFACAIDGAGRVDCFGQGQLAGMEPDRNAEAVTIGAVTACVYNRGGEATCWGDDGRGRLDLPDGAAWRSLTLTAVGGCGVRTDGVLTCWGETYDGVSDVEGPFDLVVGGSAHAAALSADGDFACVGVTSGGRCTPPGGAVYRSLAAGGRTTCGLTDGTGAIQCFGPDAGPLSPPMGSFAGITVSEDHGCAFDEDGAITCWGVDTQGEAVAPDIEVSALSTGGDTTCGIRTDGKLVCWGYLAR